MSDATPSATTPSDFIRDLVALHVAENRYPQIVTRFPPEPNGYLHLGHAKSICLNAGIALENHGRCHLRFDDTNPAKEELEYVDSILTDVRWLLSDWAESILTYKPSGSTPVTQTLDGRPDFQALPAPPDAPADTVTPFFASDYFDPLYTYAEQLILTGKAYVCDLSPEDTETYRGPPDKPGRPSPFRDRTPAENLDLFRRMRDGEFPDGTRTLRAKIDMASPNLWLRDPLLYRIRHVAHHQAGDKWCIYPLYDFAHCLSDYLEGITHSLCTLEFEVHRPLYDWILQNLDLPRPLPRQTEFAKLNLAYTLVSKRRLMTLVRENHVAGWDDPRMPTLAGLRRRGIPPAALRTFAYHIGITKYDGLTDLAVFENTVREHLNPLAPRRLAVLRPLKIIIDNFDQLPLDSFDRMPATNHPGEEGGGPRDIKANFEKEIWIEQDDFSETPPPKYFRLKPDGEVRLKYAGIVKFVSLDRSEDGTVQAVHVVLDPETLPGGSGTSRKVKGTIHWVGCQSSLPAQVRLYDRLFTHPEPASTENFLDHLNPHSLETVTARIEPALTSTPALQVVQFERLGYFTPDPKDHTPDAPVFNRTITLKDTWAKTK